jgi:RNA polymerase sigma factor (sigma-70 family)
MSVIHTTTMRIEADVLAAQQGDQQAFTRLVEASCSLVTSIALAIVRDVDMSRDIAQDVFLSAWRDMRKLRAPASFLPWIRQMTRNRAHHILRGQRRGRRRLAESDTDNLVASVVDTRPDAHQRLVSFETRRLVAEALAALPDDAREVVALYYREGRSTAQVADLLDLSEAAVRQRLARARARLRDALLERLGEELASSAPGAAFVAGIAALLTVGAPTASAAASLGASSAKAGLLAKLVPLVLGAGAGAAGGIAGVVVGLRQYRRQARDDDERRGLARVQLAAIAVVVVAAFGMPLGWELTHSRWAPVSVFVAFILALVVIYERWLPRVVRRRFEAEMREGPCQGNTPPQAGADVAHHRMEHRAALWHGRAHCRTLLDLKDR